MEGLTLRPSRWCMSKIVYFRALGYVGALLTFGGGLLIIHQLCSIIHHYPPLSTILQLLSTDSPPLSTIIHHYAPILHPFSTHYPAVSTIYPLIIHSLSTIIHHYTQTLSTHYPTILPPLSSIIHHYPLIVHSLSAIMHHYPQPLSTHAPLTILHYPP